MFFVFWVTVRRSRPKDEKATERASRRFFRSSSDRAATCGYLPGRIVMVSMCSVSPEDRFFIETV